MLGSATEADDAVQEAWLRLNGANTSEVANLGGWLTTVVARVCLDILRSRRREEALDAEVVEPIADSDNLCCDYAGASRHSLFCIPVRRTQCITIRTPSYRKL
jgi:DNA-directed RNA polymerase specialized sigma24 family protein